MSLYTDNYLNALASRDQEEIDRRIEETTALIMQHCREAKHALKQAFSTPRRARVSAYAAWLKAYGQPISLLPSGTVRSYRGCRYSHNGGVFYTYVWGDLAAFRSLSEVHSAIRWECAQ